MENGVIEAYVTNLGKYNEGELVGEWVKFPISKEEMSAVLDRIGIGAEYEEIFITDYDTALYSVSSQLGEYENLDKLNYLAGVIAELDASDREKYEAVLESGFSLGQNGIDGLINLAYNLDNYDMLPGVEDEDDLGRYYAELMYGENLDEKMGELAHYIDFERYGSDCQINDGGMFTDKGYMRETGATWDRYFDGSLEDIPDEYKLGDSATREPEKITVLVVEPMKKPYVKELEHTLENLQKEVGGSIEAVYPFEDKVAIICNDEGKFNGMQLNRCMRDQDGEIYDILAGTFLVTGLTEQNFGSLTPEQVDKFMAYYETPEMFVKMNGNLVVLPVDEPQNEVVQETNARGTFIVYQLKEIEELDAFRYASTKDLERKGLVVNPENYRIVFEAPLSDTDTLDSIYKKYNMEHPEGFKGHNLSMSDVIVLHENGKDTAHYVDYEGFVEMPEFITSMEAMQDTYSIYQLKRGEDMRDYSFASLDMLEKMGLSVNPDNYEKVYEAPKTAEDTLDSIYYRFNMEHPADFRGHSLSVSDVIVFHENGVDTAHYVDSYGFKAIPDFVTAQEIAVSMDTVGLTVEGHDGTWHSIEELTVQGNTYYLMESETYGQDANMIVVDHAGVLVAEDITAVERDNVRGIVNEVLYEKVEAMALEIVPDKTITQEDMVQYGYDWVGMIPLREQAAEKLYDAGLEIFVLNQDGSEASIDSKDYLSDHAERGGIFGVEKVAWARFIETNSLKKVEEMLEDDYGMIDGIINNGSKKEKDDKEADKKSSVREKLKEKQAVVEKNEAHVPKNKVKSKAVSID